MPVNLFLPFSENGYTFPFEAIINGTPRYFLLLLGLFVLSALFQILYNFIFMRPKVNPKNLNFMYEPSDFHEEIESAIRHKVGDYSPPWWYNKHSGTLIQLGKKVTLEYQRECFKHTDGSEFIVNWYPSRPLPSDKSKICIFVPGLGSRSTDVSCHKIYYL